ncbi:hypothetical protein [Chitinibacter sp. GC72]|uniref:hypothetical protein n=1 Tax=Chitinibacter sp. GC72 TaxID=1526917 RepID=UPI0012F74806|nr:hypothetical protein [Chitinibacter sp. GC72]
MRGAWRDGALGWRLIGQDLRLIGPQLLWAAAAIVLALGLLLSSWFVFAHIQQRMAKQSAQINQLRQLLTQERQQWQRVQQYQQPYLHLQQMRVLDSEHRLDWIEALEQLRQQQAHWHLDYAFAPQRQLSAPVADGQSAVLASKMTVSWRAGSEWDLSQFERWLTRLSGMAVARQCRFARAGTAAANMASGIAVECHYDWLSIGLHKAS